MFEQDEYSEKDERIIKMLSEMFKTSEEDIKKTYVPLSEEGEKSLRIYPITATPKKDKPSAKQKIKSDVRFLQETLLAANIYPAGENTFSADYVVSDKELRYNLQLNIMTLVKKYLEAK